MHFSVGSVINRAFSILVKNIVPFAAIAVLIYLPAIVVDVMASTQAGATLERSGETLRVTQSHQGLSVLAFLLRVIAQNVVAGAVAYGVYSSLKGKGVLFGECLSQGFRRFWPVLGVGILAGLGVVAGFVLLIVPGIILACMWYIAVPVVVVENPGIVAALSRSAELTRGHRWTVFALALVIFALAFGVSALVVLIAAGLGPLFGLVVGVAIGVFAGLFGGVCSAVAYYDLRAVKEGIDLDDLVAVFE